MLESVVVESDNKTSTSSTYIAESLDLWYAILGHVNAKSIDKLHKMGLIPNLHKSDMNKCEICVEAKFTRKSFKTVSDN